MFTFLFLACQSPQKWGYLYEDQYIIDDGYANVIRNLEFFGTNEYGEAWGFDLDNTTSPEGEDDSCGHGDLTDPEGREGIDNQMASIWDAVEPIAGTFAQEVLLVSINEGRFLVALELIGVDDLYNDDDVTFNLFQARGEPEIGTLGYISPNQSFFINKEQPFFSIEHVAIKDGTIEVGPFDYSIPLDVLELSTTLNVRQGFFRFDIRDDGSFKGYMGGALSLPEMIGDLKETDAREEVELVEPIFWINADMGYDDDTCNLFSMALAFEGTQTFIIREAEE